MNEKITVKVCEVVGSSACVSVEEGQLVQDQIAVAIRNSHNVELSFLHVTDLTPAFLNPAIGQLYGEFSDEQIRECLSITDMVNEDVALLKRVIENARRYFKDPKRINMARQEILGTS